MVPISYRRLFAIVVLVVALDAVVVAAQQTTEQQLRDLRDSVNARIDAILATLAPGEVEPTGLQAALNAAPAGARLVLTGGTVYQGNFVIRKPVTIETAGVTLPDKIVDAGDVARFAIIRSVNNAPALQVAPGVAANDVTLRSVHLEGPSNDVLLLGAGDQTQTSLTQVPRRITIDQVSIVGVGAKNGIGLHAAEVTVRRSWIRDVARAGVESHGIVCFNCPGPVTIERNVIHGSAIGIFFGGADPRIVGLIPSDITIRGNTITKHATPVNYASKNALEWKVGRRILVEENTIDGVPSGGQAGWGIQITPEQEGGAPAWAIVEALTFRRNTVRNVGGVFNILGHGQYQSTRPTLVARDLTFRDNWFRCDAALGGHGALAQLANGPVNVLFEFNTIECNGTAFIRTANAIAIPGFVFARNLQIVAGTYGLFLAGLSRGAGFTAQFPDGVLEDNAIVGADATFRRNLPTNLFIATPEGIVQDGYGVGAAAGFGRRR